MKGKGPHEGGGHLVVYRTSSWYYLGARHTRHCLECLLLGGMILTNFQIDYHAMPNEVKHAVIRLSDSQLYRVDRLFKLVNFSKPPNVRITLRDDTKFFDTDSESIYSSKIIFSTNRKKLFIFILFLNYFIVFSLEINQLRSSVNEYISLASLSSSYFKIIQTNSIFQYITVSICNLSLKRI